MLLLTVMNSAKQAEFSITTDLKTQLGEIKICKLRYLAQPNNEVIGNSNSINRHHKTLISFSKSPAQKQKIIYINQQSQNVSFKKSTFIRKASYMGVSLLF